MKHQKKSTKKPVGDPISAHTRNADKGSTSKSRRKEISVSSDEGIKSKKKVKVAQTSTKKSKK